MAARVTELAAIAAAIALAAAPPALELEQRVAVQRGSAGAALWHCYRVTSLDVGPGGEPYAWLVQVGPAPQGVAHLPARELGRPCP